MPKRLIAALNYNENKVREGKAESLFAGNFLKDISEMNFYQKLAGFERLNVLNERAKTKTLHVSLNFNPSEKLSHGILIKIAESYMNKIGFGDQPFLLYKHLDAGHPHIHIVSTTIKEDGTRINTHNIGRNQSEKARKEIEKDFSLIQAENQKHLLKQKIQPLDAAKIIYGKTETKRAITNVVNVVLNTYRYTSLPELNAVLKQYNVTADRGKEEGRIYKNRGLVYRILDDNGNKIGVPVKASSINSSPTLDKLEKLFLTNKEKKAPLKQILKNTLDELLKMRPVSLDDFLKLLEQKNVYTVLRKNKEGRIYGITFVDNHNKSVFNGSDLGRQYSVSHLQSALSIGIQKAQINASGSTGTQSLQRTPNPMVDDSPQMNKTAMKSTPVLDELLTPEKLQEFGPYRLLKKKKTRKRKNLNNDLK